MVNVAARVALAPLLKSSEVAERLNVSQPTLSRWRHSNKGPAFLSLDGALRYRIEDVEAYLKESAR